MSHQFNNGLSIDRIKKAAQGRIFDILENVAGIPGELLDGKHHPCPKCGGTDRYRLIDQETGAVFCNQCFNANNGDFIAAVQHYRGVSLPEALRLIADYLGIGTESATSKKLTGTWVYSDDNDKPLYRVKRFEWTENGERKKSFFQERFVDGKWETGIKNVQRVPFNLSAIIEKSDEPLFIVEGEKCCDALAALGFLTTTASGGCNSKLDWSKFIQNRHVVIFADQDRPGYRYALSVADSLLKAGCTVKVVFLPELAEGEDVADFIERGGTKEELLQIVEETPVWDGHNFLLERYGQADESTPEFISCGIDSLDTILSTIEPVDWRPFWTEGRNGEAKPPTERNYILRSIERVSETATEHKSPIVVKQGEFYCYTGTYYRKIDESVSQNFLIESAIRCGVPYDVAIYQFFVNRLIRQFGINIGRVSNIVEPDIAFINLKNGTLFFDKKGHRFQRHTPGQFIRYALDFDYDPSATAPRWQKHLDRSLPHPDKQAYLAKCLALPFFRGKMEKAPIFYGKRDTGKSTTLDVYQALIGDENITSESLDTLSRADSTGVFTRSRLDGKLINIGCDVSPKIADEGMAKMLISREPVSASLKGENGYTMRNYARLLFAMNDLPPQFVSEAPLRKRVALIEFDQQLSTDEIETDFVEQIIENELPGVLNWIIGGLNALNSTKRLDPPMCCMEALDRIRKEIDPISGWLDENQYYVGNSKNILLQEAYGGQTAFGNYTGFVGYCRDNGYKVPGKAKFTKRLKELGYEIGRDNHKTANFLYYSDIPPENDATGATHAPPLETQGENGGEAEAGSGLTEPNGLLFRC